MVVWIIIAEMRGIEFGKTVTFSGYRSGFPGFNMYSGRARQCGELPYNAILAKVKESVREDGEGNINDRMILLLKDVHRVQEVK